MVGKLFDNPTGRLVITMITAAVGGGIGIVTGGLGAIIMAILGGLTGLATGWDLIKEISHFIIFVIFVVALLFGLFRLWISLIKAYIFFLVDVVFGPLWILGGMLPGAQTFGFGAWLRDMLGNLSAFPTTLAMFLLGKVFVDQIKNASSDFFIPPFVGVDAQTAFPSLVGLGIILMTPEVVKITRDMFKSPELKYRTAIGQTLGTGYGVVAGVTGEIKGTLFRRTQAGVAMGPLAQVLDKARPLQNKYIRGLLGWATLEKQVEKAKTAEKT
jgi:hypothetical protein